MRITVMLKWPDGRTIAEMSRNGMSEDDAFERYKFLKWALNSASEQEVKKRLSESTAVRVKGN